MHICFLGHQEYPANYVTAFNEYTRELVEQGVDVTVIAAKQSGSESKYEIVNGVEVHRIPLDASTAFSYRPTLFAFRAFRVIDQLCETRDIDILHMRAFPNLGLALRPIPGLDRPPVTIADVRGTAISNEFFDRVSRVGIQVQRHLIDGMIVIDEAVADNVLGPDNDAAILPLGADFDLFTPGQNENLRSNWDVEPEDTVLGYTGIFYPTRDLDRLVRAFAEATEGRDGVYLVLVGDGPERENLEWLAGELGIKDQVIFTGEVPFDAIPDYVRAFDIGAAYVRDSVQYRDQPPLKTIEFLASGLPVIGTDTPGNRRFIQDGVNGLLVPDSPTHFAAGLERLLDEDALREDLRQRARDSVSEFDYTAIIRDRLIPIYESFLDRHNRA